MALPASDSFTGSLAASWATLNGGGFQIYTNCAAPNGGAYTETCIYWNAETWSDDQYSQATAQNIVTGEKYAGLAVRAQSGPSYYGVYWTSGTADAFRMKDGTWANDIWASGSGSFSPPSEGAVVRLEVEGSATVTVRVYYDDVLQQTLTDTSAGRISSGGNAGLSGYGSDIGQRLDDWEGGLLDGGGSSTPKGRMLMLGVG